MHHLKNKKCVVLCLYIGFFVLIISGFTQPWFGNTPSDEEIIIKTFRCSGAEFQRLVVSGWQTVDSAKYRTDSLNSLKERFAYLFPADFKSTIQSTENNGSTTVTISGHTEHDINASLTLAINPNELSHRNESYLILSLESRNPGSYREMKNMFNKVMSDKSNKSIVVSGYIDKKLSPLEADAILHKMLTSITAHNVETMANQSLVSVSGYSPNVRNLLTLNGKWVNINMALRYNSLEQRTRVYVGSPVITSEY